MKIIMIIELDVMEIITLIGGVIFNYFESENKKKVFKDNF